MFLAAKKAVISYKITKAYQKKTLEERFKENPVISSVEMSKLANSINSTYEQVRLWFKNRNNKQTVKIVEVEPRPDESDGHFSEPEVLCVQHLKTPAAELGSTNQEECGTSSKLDPQEPSQNTSGRYSLNATASVITDTKPTKLEVPKEKESGTIPNIMTMICEAQASSAVGEESVMVYPSASQSECPKVDDFATDTKQGGAGENLTCIEELNQVVFSPKFISTNTPETLGVIGNGGRSQSSAASGADVQGMEQSGAQANVPPGGEDSSSEDDIQVVWSSPIFASGGEYHLA